MIIETLFFVGWLTVAGQQVLTVQEVPAVTCAHLWESAKQTGDFDRTGCFGEASNVQALVESHGCQPLEVRENFVNFICRKPI